MNLTDPAVLGATLKDLLRTDSGRMLAEPAYLKARLSDRVPQASREISLLVESQPAGVAETLRTKPATASLHNALTSKLQNERGFSAEAANWAVDCWAAALDVRFMPDPPKDEHKRPEPIRRSVPRLPSSIAGPLLLVFLIWVRPWDAVSYTKGEGLHWSQDWHLPWTDPKPEPKPNPVVPTIDPLKIFKLPKIDDNNLALQPLPKTPNPLPPGTTLQLVTPRCWPEIPSLTADACELTNMKGWDNQKTYQGLVDSMNQSRAAVNGDIQGTVGQEISVPGPSATCAPAGEWTGHASLTSGALPAGLTMLPGGSIIGTPTEAGDSTATLMLDNIKCNGVSYYELRQEVSFHIAPAVRSLAPNPDSNFEKALQQYFANQEKGSAK